MTRNLYKVSWIQKFSGIKIIFFRISRNIWKVEKILYQKKIIFLTWNFLHILQKISKNFSENLRLKKIFFHYLIKKSPNTLITLITNFRLSLAQSLQFPFKNWLHLPLRQLYIHPCLSQPIIPSPSCPSPFSCLCVSPPRRSLSAVTSSIGWKCAPLHRSLAFRIGTYFRTWSTAFSNWAFE